MDDLIELANARSRITGENAAEEYLRLLLRLGMAEEVEPTKAAMEVIDEFEKGREFPE
jgi:hypothetical protein